MAANQEQDMQQTTRPEHVVDRQIRAFNDHDADAFADTYAPDGMILSGLSDEAPLEGRTAIAEHYRQLFKQVPSVAASIDQRLIVANLFTDSESIEPLGKKALVPYEVEGEFIRRAWMFGPL